MDAPDLAEPTYQFFFGVVAMIRKRQCRSPERNIMKLIWFASPSLYLTILISLTRGDLLQIYDSSRYVTTHPILLAICLQLRLGVQATDCHCTVNSSPHVGG